MIGQLVERGLDPGLKIGLRGTGAEGLEESAPEGIGGEEAMEITAHDLAVGRARPFGAARQIEHRAGAVGSRRLS